MRKILVPVDFSAPSRRALDEAIGLAKAFGAELHLLHCYQFLPHMLEAYGVEKPRSFEHDMEEAAQRKMDEWSESVRKQGVAVQTQMAANLPSRETIELAARIGADLIVLGTKGLSGLKHVLLGSVAERVVQHAPCPVLTVPAEGRAAHRIAKILLPVDFSDHAQRAFDLAVELAKAFDAELHLLHCYEIYTPAVSPYGIAVPDSFVHEVRRAAQQRLSQLRDQAASRGVRAHDHLSALFPSEEIVATAERLDIDLVVMGTRGLSGLKHVLLGSVAERTIRNAPCPVLTVKGLR